MNLTGSQIINMVAGRVFSHVMPCLHAIGLLAVSAAFLDRGARAATGPVTFTGNVSVVNSCNIAVQNNGRFGQAANLRQLSSKLAGGAPAVAIITATRNYLISAIAAPALTSFPTGGDTGVTMASRYSGQSISNGRTFGERNGTSQVRLRNGLSTTRVTVHLSATRAGSAFPSGYYQGTVTVRCE